MTMFRRKEGRNEVEGGSAGTCIVTESVRWSQVIVHALVRACACVVLMVVVVCVSCRSDQETTVDATHV